MAAFFLYPLHMATTSDHPQTRKHAIYVCNCQHYAVCVGTSESCMPSHRLRWLNLGYLSFPFWNVYVLANLILTVMWVYLHLVYLSTVYVKCTGPILFVSILHVYRYIQLYVIKLFNLGLLEDQD